MSHKIALYTLNVGNTHTSLLAWYGQTKPKPSVVAVWKTGSPMTPSRIGSRLISTVPVLVAGVVPVYQRMVVRYLRKIESETLVFRKNLQPCIEIVPKPSQNVGDDRIAAALGALGFDSSRPSVVVDAGTALTINAVSPGTARKPPRFEGGLIVPGAQICLYALGRFTAQLPHVDLESIAAAGYIGRSTREAIGLGVRRAELAAAIELARGQMCELGKNARVWLTGGGADRNFQKAFQQAFGRNISYYPHLVHRGLYQAWLDRDSRI